MFDCLVVLLLLGTFGLKILLIYENYMNIYKYYLSRLFKLMIYVCGFDWLQIRFLKMNTLKIIMFARKKFQ